MLHTCDGLMWIFMWPRINSWKGIYVLYVIKRREFQHWKVNKLLKINLSIERSIHSKHSHTYSIILRTYCCARYTRCVTTRRTNTNCYTHTHCVPIINVISPLNIRKKIVCFLLLPFVFEESEVITFYVRSTCIAISIRETKNCYSAQTHI